MPPKAIYGLLSAQYQINISNPFRSHGLEQTRVRRTSSNAARPAKVSLPPTMAELLPITNATADEEARWLKLADVALGQTALEPSTPMAGDRAHSEHEALKGELQAALDNLDEDRRKVA